MTAKIKRELRKTDPRSTSQLIEDALRKDEDTNAYWDIVWTLRDRPTRETFEIARGLCESEKIKHRALGANILAQLGVSMESHAPTFKEETLAILLPMLDDPRNAKPKRLGTLISALGHSHDERVAAPVARFKNHPDVKVRLDVTMSLSGLECDIALESLIELSQDEDPVVRDWATFGLGALNERDTPEIRAALFNRLDDPDKATRNEAIRGLVERRDKRVLPALIRELKDPNPHGLAFDAAYDLADRTLLPTLLELEAANKELGVEDEALNEAIAKCRANLT